MSEESTKVYKLIHPIEPVSGDGPAIEELQFHKPTLGELRKNDILDKDGQATKIAKMLCASTGKPMKILERLHWEDWQKIQEECMDFLGLQAE